MPALFRNRNDAPARIHGRSLWCATYLALLVLCLALGGCGERQAPVDVAAAQRILLRGNGAEPQTLDPQFAIGVPEANILYALYEGLVTPDPQTLEPQPGVAKSWETSADGTRYTFRLRENARWSDGSPVVAEDFAFAYRRALSPALGAQNAALLYVLKNAREYHAGQLKDFAQVGVRVIDSHTLELTLAEATPYFLGLLQHPAWSPLHRPTLERFNATASRDSRWTRPGVLVSNGAFMLEDWNVGESLTVRKNPHHRDADAIWLNAVRFYPITNLNTEERSFRAGQLHVTNALPLSKVRRYLESNSPELYNQPYLGTYYYTFNCKRKPFDDPRVRRALSLVVNREAIATHVLAAGQKPAFALVPPGTANHKAGAELRGSLEEARTLLAEAGYAGGVGFPQISLLYNTSENHKLVAEAVQRMWQEALGIRVNLVNQDWKVYLESRSNGDYDIARGGWIGDYNDPSTFLDLFQGGSGLNWSGWSHPRYDALLANAAKESDLGTRAQHLQEAEQILLDEAPILPLYFYVSNYLLSPAVEGWHPNVLDQHPYARLRLRGKDEGAAASPTATEGGAP